MWYVRSNMTLATKGEASSVKDVILYKNKKNVSCVIYVYISLLSEVAALVYGTRHVRIWV